MLSSGSLLIIANILMSALPAATNMGSGKAPEALPASAYQMEYSQTSVGGAASDSETYSSHDCLIVGAADSQSQTSESYSTSNAMGSGSAALNSTADPSWTLY
jgi:hypothetical protein